MSLRGRGANPSTPAATPPGLPPDAKPASYEDIIDALATQEGIPSALARAVAFKESSMRPDAIGDSNLPGGASVGLFQLRPDTAKDMGVDPADPIQNIRGGVKYLKLLNDRYQGDVTKILQAYNGGMKWVDEGTVSPEAQAYAAEIIGNLGKPRGTTPAQRPPQTAPAASPAGPGRGVNPSTMPTGGTPPPGTAGPLVGSLVQGMNPMTPEGRRNLAATGGSILATWATAGTAPAIAGTAAVAPWIARLLGVGSSTVAAVAGAGAGGALAETGEQMAGTKPTDRGEIAKAGAEQAAYEVAGHAALWPGRRIARSVLARKVAKNAVTGLKAGYESAVQAGRELTHATRQAVGDAVAAARELAAATRRAVQQQGARTVETTVRQGRQAITQATETATQRASADLAQAELDAADMIAQAAKPIEALPQPSTLQVGEDVRQVVSGLPGVLGEGVGPAKRAIDAAGEAVRLAAEKGPVVDITPVGQALDDMIARQRPPSLYPPTQDADAVGRAVGFGQPTAAAAATPSVPRSGMTPAAIAARQAEIMAMAQGLPTGHPLPGALGKLQQALVNNNGQLSFADAHTLKRLLDEAVNWDEAAKKHLEGMTKGIRIALRDVMVGNPEYDVANAAYHSLVPYYRKGTGRQIIKAASTPDGADKIARTLSEKNPAGALAMRQLLLEQSAKGGDAALGQQAWDSVRSAFVYDKVIKGGPKGMQERLHQLLEANPDFTKIVFDDPTAATILSNLDKISLAYDMAVQQAGERVATTAAAGKTAVESAKTTAKDTAQSAIDAAKRASEAANAAAEVRTGRDVRTVQKAGADQQFDAATTARAGRVAEQEKATRFRESSLPGYARQKLASEAADVMRVAGAPGQIWQFLSAARLILQGPKAADIVEWAAYSPARTQILVNVLMGRSLDVAQSAFIRDMLTVAGINAEGLTNAVQPPTTPTSTQPPQPSAAPPAAR